MFPKHEGSSIDSGLLFIPRLTDAFIEVLDQKKKIIFHNPIYNTIIKQNTYEDTLEGATEIKRHSWYKPATPADATQAKRRSSAWHCCILLHETALQLPGYSLAC